MGTTIRESALLLVMTTIFAVLALDIAVPALVLSLMALSRWLVSLEIYPVEPRGKTA
ncbi:MULTISPECIES: hypothetical protein [unclassified Neorhizobium]|uniref:hypothetical protein n=1 Tax=unclassified Neorhizobium TaxID=2629175 RepID=UPI0028652E6B|nr:hypothetical protein [Neorhizobium sp. 2083]MDR6814886.1 hypothetical protein [Neorhizobium sp. 2083]